MKEQELREYQIEFEKIRRDFQVEYKELRSLVNKFTKDYSIETIQSLTLDEYVVGKGDQTFCNRIENELNDWGNIHGATASKFGVYYGKRGADQDKEYRIGKKAFGSNIDIAFENIKSSIVELIENEENYELLKKNLISPMFKGKILSLYHPTKFLNIYSANHLNYFINILGLVNNSSSEIEKQRALLEFKNNDSVMQSWTIFEFTKFLYHSFGKPNSEVKEDDMPKDLLSVIYTDFPPIEKVKFDFVDLKTSKLPTPNTPQKIKGIRKTDYVAQSKRNRRIGDRGEQIVVLAERQYLTKNGRADLAEKVDQISIRDDSIGYDIRSYYINGEDKFIEVKSTTNPVGATNIFISANEVKKAKEIENFFFYIVYLVGDMNTLIWSIKGSDLLDDENIRIEPIQFRLDLITQE